MQADWKVHVPNLLIEIGGNPACAVLRQPLHILQAILAEVAARAIELNDPQLHRLMLRLVLYEQGDPTSKDYRPELLKEGTTT
jgi:hypothetical protein